MSDGPDRSMHGGEAGRDVTPHATPQIEPIWDIAGLRDHACDVVTASSQGSEVVVTFGASRDALVPGREMTVALRQQIALQPRAAARLLGALRAVIAEADAVGGRS